MGNIVGSYYVFKSSHAVILYACIYINNLMFLFAGRLPSSSYRLSISLVDDVMAAPAVFFGTASRL